MVIRDHSYKPSVVLELLKTRMYVSHMLCQHFNTYVSRLSLALLAEMLALTLPEPVEEDGTRIR